MTETPIRRGTARRLGLIPPLPYLTLRIEPDLSMLRAFGVPAPTDSDWQRLCRSFQQLVVGVDLASAEFPQVAPKEPG